MSSQLKREDDEPPNNELATRGTAEETTRAPLCQQSADSIELERKLLADLQTNVARQQEIESSMKKVISAEREVASNMEFAVSSEKETTSLMEELEIRRAMLESTGEWAAPSQEWYAYEKERVAYLMETLASWKTVLLSTKEELVLLKRTLCEALYEASQTQANTAKAMLRLGQVNELKEER